MNAAQGAGAQSVVEMLAPLREPAAVAWWPPAPGWWVLGALLLALLLAALRQLWRYHRRGAPLREAKAALASIDASALAPAEELARLATLQRRLAIRIAGRERCAGLTGSAWIGFLNSLVTTDEPPFDARLADLNYRPAVTAADSAALREATGRWLNALARPQ